MATSKDFIEYFQEQVEASGAGEIYCRKMFGDYGVYCDGVFLAWSVMINFLSKSQKWAWQFWAKIIQLGWHMTVLKRRCLK